MIFFQLFNWFQQFSSENCFPKVAGHSLEQIKNYHFERGVDGFSYFSLISVILFSDQDHPCHLLEHLIESKRYMISHWMVPYKL